MCYAQNRPLTAGSTTILTCSAISLSISLCISCTLHAVMQLQAWDFLDIYSFLQTSRVIQNSVILTQVAMLLSNKTWVFLKCNVLYLNDLFQRFGRACCLHLQCKNVSRKRKIVSARKEVAETWLFANFYSIISEMRVKTRCIFGQIWWWKGYVPSKPLCSSSRRPGSLI